MIFLGVGILCILNTIRVAMALNSGDPDRLKQVSGMDGRWPAVVLLFLSIAVACVALGWPYIYAALFPVGH